MDGTTHPELLTSAAAPMPEPAAEPSEVKQPVVVIQTVAAPEPVEVPASAPVAFVPAPFQPLVEALPMKYEVAPMLPPVIPAPIMVVQGPLMMQAMQMMQAMHVPASMGNALPSMATAPLPQSLPASVPAPKPKPLARKRSPSPVKRKGPVLNLAQLENSILWEVS